MAACCVGQQSVLPALPGLAVYWFTELLVSIIPIGVQKGGSQYSPAIYTIDIAYKIDIPL